jgi:transcriptional regulator with XRE-family HTH domain
MFAYLEHSAVMARGIPNPTSPDQIGERLRITRAALGHTQAVMANLMGSSTGGQAWENYEAGRRRISIDHALKLCMHLGLTLDWIYRGDIRSLPTELGERIQVQLRLESESARRRIVGRSS